MQQEYSALYGTICSRRVTFNGIYSHNDDPYTAVEVCDCDAGTKCHDDSTHGSGGILCEHNDDVTKTMLRRELWKPSESYMIKCANYITIEVLRQSRVSLSLMTTLLESHLGTCSGRLEAERAGSWPRNRHEY